MGADVATPLWPATRLWAWLRGVEGSFPPGGIPRRARSRSVSASGPAGWCGRPIGRVQAQPGVSTLCCMGKSEEEDWMRLTGGSRWSANESKRVALLGCWCRMDLPGPTTSVGTRTDYSVGPWDYPACATRHLMAWGARTTVEKYSDRKLYMSCTV
jgi:hypothetical protein